MADFDSFKKNWLRPFLFYGNNPLSLIGGALTSASALVLIGFWVVDIFGHGGSDNPYLGIIFDLVLPGVFIFGPRSHSHRHLLEAKASQDDRAGTFHLPGDRFS